MTPIPVVLEFPVRAKDAPPNAARVPSAVVLDTPVSDTVTPDGISNAPHS
jgi:hypothetical protein